MSLILNNRAQTSNVNKHAQVAYTFSHMPKSIYGNSFRGGTLSTYFCHPFLFYSILFYPITLGGRRGTTDEFATIPFHLNLFSAALVELAKSIPVHSLILSSHLFFCLHPFQWGSNLRVKKCSFSEQFVFL